MSGIKNRVEHLPKSSQGKEGWPDCCVCVLPCMFLLVPTSYISSKVRKSSVAQTEYFLREEDAASSLFPGVFGRHDRSEPDHDHGWKWKVHRVSRLSETESFLHASLHTFYLDSGEKVQLGITLLGWWDAISFFYYNRSFRSK